MREVLAHRGPDGAGTHVAGGTALAHRRLSIIDLEGGSQPLANEDGSIWVVLNGEIYNYRELTRHLQARGHRFATRSDTEVIVHGYEEYGLDVVRHLNGMFAFALVDERRGRLVLARDHFGIKPMFYARRDDRLLFASEIKSLLVGLERVPGPDPGALAEYLVFRYVAWDRTFFEGIHRLPPGHLGIWERGAFRVQEYWSPAQVEPAHAGALDEAVRCLDERLGEAVVRQMVSDVPLGAFCSGGVDSGLVTAFASRAADHRLATFSVGFDDARWDETALARRTAERFDTAHHVIVCRQDDLARYLPRLIWFHDEPLSQPNSIPLYVLSGLAREHVTVVLTGEGSDEVYGGYPRYLIAVLRHAAERLPAGARRLAGALARRVPDHRWYRLGWHLARHGPDSTLLNAAFVDPELVARLTGVAPDRVLESRRALLAARAVPNDPLATLSRLEISTYLVSLLDRMDRMAMAHGLEGRVPFLDVELATWGLALPSRLKTSLRTAKPLVRALARRRLTPDVAGGRKSGFGLPLDAWFRSPALGSFLDRLRDPAHAAAAFFDRGALDAVIHAHAARRADHGELLWLIANIFVWQEVFGNGSSPRAPTAGT